MHANYTKLPCSCSYTSIYCLDKTGSLEEDIVDPFEQETNEPKAEVVQEDMEKKTTADQANEYDPFEAEAAQENNLDELNETKSPALLWKSLSKAEQITEASNIAGFSFICIYSYRNNYICP